MEKIVRNLLDFGGDRPTHKKPLTVGGLVARCCTSLAGFADANEVRLSSENGTGKNSVLADGVSLARTITELLRNAIQAAAGGEVQVRTFADGNDAVIVVEDDGTGVDEEIRSRIFEPFFTTKPVGQGSGLGLSIAHRTIEDLDGTIQVGTASLGGARFTIRIPIVAGRQ
jgi:signal transduction histidine kinase